MKFGNVMRSARSGVARIMNRRGIAMVIMISIAVSFLGYEFGWLPFPSGGREVDVIIDETGDWSALFPGWNESLNTLPLDVRIKLYDTDPDLIGGNIRLLETFTLQAGKYFCWSTFCYPEDVVIYASMELIPPPEIEVDYVLISEVVSVPKETGTVSGTKIVSIANMVRIGISSRYIDLGNLHPHYRPLGLL